MPDCRRRSADDGASPSDRFDLLELDSHATKLDLRVAPAVNPQPCLRAPAAHVPRPKPPLAGGVRLHGNVLRRTAINFAHVSKAAALEKLHGTPRQPDEFRGTELRTVQIAGSKLRSADQNLTQRISGVAAAVCTYITRLTRHSSIGVCGQLHWALC